MTTAADGGARPVIFSSICLRRVMGRQDTRRDSTITGKKLRQAGSEPVPSSRLRRFNHCRALHQRRPRSRGMTHNPGAIRFSGPAPRPRGGREPWSRRIVGNRAIGSRRSSAFSGSGWTSRIRPSAPAATLAAAMLRHQVGMPRAVAGIDDHRQMRLGVQVQHRGQGRA